MRHRPLCFALLTLLLFPCIGRCQPEPHVEIDAVRFKLEGIEVRNGYPGTHVAFVVSFSANRTSAAAGVTALTVGPFLNVNPGGLTLFVGQQKTKDMVTPSGGPDLDETLQGFWFSLSQFEAMKDGDPIFIGPWNAPFGLSGMPSKPKLLRIGTLDKASVNYGPEVWARIDSPKHWDNWTNSDVVLSFVCRATVNPVQECPEPVTVAGNTAGTVVTRGASDTKGNRRSISVMVRIDKIKPVLTIDSLANHSTVAGATTTVTGTADDPGPVASGVVQVFCNGKEGTLANGKFTCHVDTPYPITPIEVQAFDRAGNIVSTGVTVQGPGQEVPRFSLKGLRVDTWNGKTYVQFLIHNREVLVARGGSEGVCVGHLASMLNGGHAEGEESSATFTVEQFQKMSDGDPITVNEYSGTCGEVPDGLFVGYLDKSSVNLTPDR